MGMDALVVAVLGVGVVLAGLLTWVGFVNKSMTRTLEFLMTNLHREHMLALEALTLDIDRVKERVKRLEDA